MYQPFQKTRTKQGDEAEDIGAISGATLRQHLSTGAGKTGKISGENRDETRNEEIFLPVVLLHPSFPGDCTLRAMCHFWNTPVMHIGAFVTLSAPLLRM